MTDGGHARHEGMNAADILLQCAREQNLGASPAIETLNGTVTYDELDLAACRCAQALQKLGVGVQDRVLILLDDRPEFFYVYLGAMKIGAVPVALNLRASGSELNFIIKDSACKAIISEDEYLDLLLAHDRGVGERPEIFEFGTRSGKAKFFEDIVEDRDGKLQSVLLNGDDMALWMYTSGTTGAAKGVVHRIRSMTGVGRYLGPVYGVRPGKKVFCSSKLFFAFSLGHGLLSALRLGATAVLHTGWPSPEAISETVEAVHPDIVLSVPTMYRGLLASGLATTGAFKKVSHYISAGEHLPERVFAEWQAVTGRPILNGIGATETLMMFVANYPENVVSGSTGEPLPETDVRLVSHDGIDIEEPGLPGVLWVRSESLASGYWDQQDKTDAVFVDGWYSTGDIFVRDGNGILYHQGRDDDMLKISGQWVSPAEIDEHVLKNGKVLEAATVGIQNERGLARLALCLVPERPDVDREELEREITEHLTDHLSVYKCPRRFVYLDTLPKTATGKIQRFKLRQYCADQLGTVS